MFQVVVLPTDETLDYLKRCFQATNVTIDWDNLHVELATVKEAPTLKSEVVYQFNPSSMGIWYDLDAGRPSLLMPLLSGDRALQRFNELGDYWERQFVPYMQITDQFNNRRSTKARLNSIATGLVEVQPILEFDSEMLIELQDYQQHRPAHRAFYQDYLARGGVSNTVFIDEEKY
jgi:hypothetical protein